MLPNIYIKKILGKFWKFGIDEFQQFVDFLQIYDSVFIFNSTHLVTYANNTNIIVTLIEIFQKVSQRVRVELKINETKLTTQTK